MNANDDKLHDALGRLPREVQPAHDLWPGIAARLAARPRAVRPLWTYGLAASLLLAVAAGSLWVGFGRHADGGAAAPAASIGDNAYFAQRAAFAESTVQGATNLSPETRAVILKNLRIIESSMQQIQQALVNDPNNPRLRALLYDLYQNEARLLAATQQVQARNNVRNDL